MLTESTITRANKYCKDYISSIENYKEAISSDKKYVCHHKLGINVSKEELIEKGMYYNRPSGELIFLDIGEHRKLHMQNIREETKKKLSDNHADVKGEKNPMYGKGYLIAGEKHYNAIKCTINNKTYGCLKDAYKDINPEYTYRSFVRKYKEGKL